MNFGEKLRELRRERNLTQPELAESIGIEQSYLSKLENGKSLPSNDVLNRILEVFDLQVGDLVDDLDQGVRNQLRQIPGVADHFNRQKELMIGNRRRWLLASSASLGLGIALIYAGAAHLFLSDFAYTYMSHGIVHEGESKEVFTAISPRTPFATMQRGSSADALRERLDEDFITTRRYRGNVFNVPVEGGSRTYYLERETEVSPWQNKLVVFLGVLTAVLGATGLAIEKKLSSFP
jgi:transcriptional regulator with XRE-family HTH domain